MTRHDRLSDSAPLYALFIVGAIIVAVMLVLAVLL